MQTCPINVKGYDKKPSKPLYHSYLPKHSINYLFIYFDIHMYSPLSNIYLLTEESCLARFTWALPMVGDP